MVTAPPDAAQSRKRFLTGLLFLAANLVVSVAAQFVLKAAMARLGKFGEGGDALAYLISMINPMVIGGLALYASGTVLWLLTLTKLELSFAYPVATVQYLLVFIGAWLIFDESISWLRVLGLAVITGGVLIISMDHWKK
ncbi:MAG: hypothetical protein NW241_18900 [Bacteroidia bacterium]|nr:hypothetical protein [Bacteroidia bacterium]